MGDLHIATLFTQFI